HSVLGRARRVLLQSCFAAGFATSAVLPVKAADLAVKAPILETGQFRVFVEGGAFWTGGDPIPFSGSFFGRGGPILLVDGGVDPTVRPKIGWNIATGFDYRFAGTPWHINGQARYGEAHGRAASSSAISVVSSTDGFTL